MAPESPIIPLRYHRNPDTGVYFYTNAPPFPYSDGDEAEKHLLQFIRASDDRSCGSADLAAGIVDWPSYYHLSHLRSNILRPVAELLHGDVLEVGAGCGALTRFLGETARSVVAVEGSPRRAEIAAARCAGLPNVSVYCDHFGRFQAERKLDAVVCVGVMEYSPIFFGGSDPFGQMLAVAARHLADEGYLLIAIENRLGLKYFAGAPEDHTGIPFQGIEDLYAARGPRTLGRLEWSRQLSACGLECTAFLYPFPDYKHPEVILSEAAFADPDMDASQFIRHLSSPNQDRNYERILSEELVWPVLARNGIAADLANSFLIVARKKGSFQPRWQPTSLVYQYDSETHPAHTRETRFARDVSGQLTARYANAPSDRELADEPLPSGTPYMDGLYSVVNCPAWTHAAIAHWAEPWSRYLDSRATIAASMLPGNLADCIPPHLFTAAGGAIQMFNAGFAAPYPVPVDFVLFRGFVESLMRIRTCAMPQLLDTITYAECAFGAMDALGVRVNPERRDALIRMEAELQHVVRDTPLDASEDRIRGARFTVRAAGPSKISPAEYFESQVFWRCDLDVFTEFCSRRVRSEVEPGVKRIRIEIPDSDPPPVELRLDLSDRPGVFSLLDIRVLSIEGRVLWAWDHNPEGFTGRNEILLLRLEPSSEVIAVMPAADPFLLLPIPPLELTNLRAGGAIDFRICRDDPTGVIRKLASGLAAIRRDRL